MKKLLVVVAAMAAFSAHADTYPSKPITIVVPLSLIHI